MDHPLKNFHYHHHHHHHHRHHHHPPLSSITTNVLIGLLTTFPCLPLLGLAFAVVACYVLGVVMSTPKPSLLRLNLLPLAVQIVARYVHLLSFIRPKRPAHCHFSLVIVVRRSCRPILSRISLAVL